MYETQYHLTLDGKAIGKGKIVSEEGQVSTISRPGEFLIEMTVHKHSAPKNKKAVMIDFVVKDSDGKVLSNAKVITPEGHKAQMIEETGKTLALEVESESLRF